MSTEGIIITAITVVFAFLVIRGVIQMSKDSKAKEKEDTSDSPIFGEKKKPEL